MSALFWSAAWSLPASKYSVWQWKDGGKAQCVYVLQKERKLFVWGWMKLQFICPLALEWLRVTDRLRTEKWEVTEELVLSIQPWLIDSYTSTLCCSWNQCCAVLSLVSIRERTHIYTHTHNALNYTHTYARTLQDSYGGAFLITFWICLW